ncbi:MAG: tRNA lysidine(34) synthetase TilS [Clostridiales bacterium]|nr:tRNA lysidine(34) synthetase TilS [Clostridiales bacterium]
MLNRIKKFIEENELLTKGDRVVLGLSGGADSVCLLKVLFALKDEYDLKLWAVHVNHNIRGKEALRDRDFSKALCEAEGVEIFVYSYDIPSLSKAEGFTEEETGRNYRYKAFYETAERVGANRIALAHNKNDNAETMLQRLIRGSGLKGLGGILPKRDKIIRPLLCLSRAEIEAFLGDTPYITDSTNQSLEYLRNKIRHKLLPSIEEDINPNIVEVLFKTSGIIRRENNFLEEEAKKAYERVLIKKDKDSISLSCERLSAENEVLQNRVLRLASLPLTKKMQDIELKHIKGLKDLAEGQNGRQISLIEGIKAKKEGDALVIGKFSEEPIEYSYELYPEKEIFIREACIELILTKNKLPQKEIGRLNLEEADLPLIVRTKRDGDRLKIKNGSQQIKKIYSEYKIPRSKHCFYPVVAAQNRVIAVLNLKTAADAFTPDGAYGLYVISQ